MEPASIFRSILRNGIRQTFFGKVFPFRLFSQSQIMSEDEPTNGRRRRRGRRRPPYRAGSVFRLGVKKQENTAKSLEKTVPSPRYSGERGKCKTPLRWFRRLFRKPTTPNPPPFCKRSLPRYGIKQQHLSENPPKPLDFPPCEGYYAITCRVFTVFDHKPLVLFRQYGEYAFLPAFIFPSVRRVRLPSGFYFSAKFRREPAKRCCEEPS